MSADVGQLGFCSIAALDRPLAEVARATARAGADGLEITARPPHLAPDASLEDAGAAGATVRACGLAVLAYGSYLGHGLRSDEDVEREVARAEAMAAPLLRVWAAPAPDAPNEGFAETVDLLGRASDRAASAGIDVVVERHIGSFADTPERVEKLLAAVARRNFALNYQVLDLLPMAEALAQPADARRLLPHARYVHLKNYRAPERGGERMLPGGSLETGVLDHGALLAAIHASGYRGPLAIEFLSNEPGRLEEKLAREIAFVRRGLQGREAS